MLASGRSRRPVASMTHPAAIAFLHNSGNAVIADDVANTIYSLTDGQVFQIASAQDGITQPNSIGSVKRQSTRLRRQLSIRFHNDDRAERHYFPGAGVQLQPDGFISN